MNISIIIPVFNGEKYIERCIASIEQEKKYSKNIDVIVVDDGSTDNTYTISESLTRKYDNVRVFHKENGGVSSARNYGLTVAHGDFILFVDADDTLEENAILSIVNEMDKYDADYYLFSFNKETKRNFIMQQHYRDEGKTVDVEIAYENFFFDGNNGPWSKLFKLSIIRQNELFFDETLKIHEDVVFCMRYLECCRSVRYSDKSIYTYKYNESGAVRNHKLEYISNYSEVYYIWKNYLKSHGLDNYLVTLNESFVDKMFIECVKLSKQGKSSQVINMALDNRFFNELNEIKVKKIRYKIEKQILIKKLYWLFTFLCK